MTARLLSVTDATIKSIDSNTIAYISCDNAAYKGNLQASDVIRMAKEADPPPVSIVLWSSVANHCSLSNPSYLNYDPVFTTTSPVDAGEVARRIANNSQPNGWSLLPDTSATPTGSSSRGGGGGNNGAFNCTDTDLAFESLLTLSVAMIILYSITGIITALFLVIIITGAIRAHRHPERYGPRNIVGRPRQSRARGVARAMLETLPIVRFGDQEEQRPKQVGGEGDVELGESQSRETRVNNAGARANTSPTDNEGRNPTATSDNNRTTDGAGAATVPHHGDGTTEDGTLGCSICTEDFAQGEHVRVLPCNHKFHPACVDPWLLDVSGTCPLCRVDLRPPGSSNPASPTSETPGTPNGHLPPPLTEQSSSALAGTGPPPTNRRRDTLRATFALSRLRDMGPEERIAALRHLRRNRRSTVISSAAESAREGSHSQRGGSAEPQRAADATPSEPTPEPSAESDGTAPTTWRERMRGRLRR